MPVIAIAGILHESNSFNPARTGIRDFQQRPVSLDDWAKGSTEVAGFIEEGRRQSFDLRPILYANATPKGPVDAAAFEELTARLTAGLKGIRPLDGILLALHGAMVAEKFPHGDQEIVRRVRSVVGPDLPLMVTHDFHANVSPEIVAMTTALLTYQQNPHLDTKQRGERAARILARTLRREIRPVQAIDKPPMIWNIVYQHTYSEPFLPFTRASMELENQPGILAASVSGGYQYADVPYVGPSVVVVADRDVERAQREAAGISNGMWQAREQLVLRAPDPASAVKRAMQAGKHPVALFDAGDNIGGGSAGDSTFLLEELLRQKARGWVVTIADPEAVQTAKRAGIEGRFEMAVGGKTDSMHGKPAPVRGIVRSLHLGKYIETAVRHGGRRYWDLGHAAVIEVEGSTPEDLNLLLVTTLRSSPDSLNQLVSCGVYPERQKILVAKGTIAPRAAYEPVAADIVIVDSPGATAVNPARFEFKSVRPGVWGLRPGGV